MLDPVLHRAFWRMLITWLVIIMTGRCLRLVLLFEAVSSCVPPAVVGSFVTIGAVVGALISIIAGRAYNRFGPRWLNVAAGLIVIGAGLHLHFFPTCNDTLVQSAVAYSLICMAIVMSNTAVYRACGSIFQGGPRVTAFSRLNALYSVIEILSPLGIGILYEICPDMLAALLIAFATVSLFMPGPFPASLMARKAQTATNSLLYSLKRLTVSRVLLGGTIAGAAIHAVVATFMLVLPISAPGLSMSMADIGYLLAAFAFAQFLGCFVLSASPAPDKLCSRMFMTLAAGGLVLGAAFWSTSFAAMLVLSFLLGAALGPIQPLSMSMIFQYSEPGSVGDILGVRLMLNNFARIIAPLSMGFALDVMSGPCFLSWTGAAILAATFGALLYSRVSRAA